MLLSRAATLLAAVAATGPNETDENIERLWASILPDDITEAEGMAAIQQHRAESPGVYLEPGHIIILVRKARRANQAKHDITDVPYPAALADDPAAERRWGQMWRDAVGTGLDRDTAARMVNEALSVDTTPQLPAAGARPAELLAAALGARKGIPKPRPETPITPDAAIEYVRAAASAGPISGLSTIHIRQDGTGSLIPMNVALAFIEDARQVRWIRGFDGHDLQVTGDTHRTWVFAVKRPAGAALRAWNRPPDYADDMHDEATVGAE